MKTNFEDCVFLGNLIGKQLLVRTLMGSVVFSLLVTISQAQTVRPPLSAAAIFPNAYSLKEADAFSLFSNQAALAHISTLSAGIYGERRFLLQELAFYQAAFCLPTTSGSFGFAGRYRGNSSFGEGGAGLAYGRKLGSKVDMGAQFNYHAVKLAGYGSASTISVETGALLHLAEEVHLGLHISNPTSARLGKEGQDLLPVVYTAGVGYEVSPQFFVAGEVEKTVHRHATVNAGIQYRFEERLWARAGVLSGSSEYYIGLGYGFNEYRLEVLASVHPQLGVTPALQIIFHQKEKKP